MFVIFFINKKNNKFEIFLKINFNFLELKKTN